MAAALASWNDGPSKRAITDFATRVATEGGPDYVPPAERIAVFDNDGTLWCEKPMPIELGFILSGWRPWPARNRPCASSSRGRPPARRTTHWLGEVITKHYNGDDSDVQGADRRHPQDVRRHDRSTTTASTPAASSGRPAPDAEAARCATAATQPMVELLRYLEAEGLHQLHRLGRRPRLHARRDRRDLRHSARARDRQHQRACSTQDGPDGGSIVYLAKPDVFDDGPAKPVRIWSRIGRRPILAFGNSNGDIQMLQFAGGRNRPALRLLLLHDDTAREFDYVGGAEKSLELATTPGWTGRQHEERLDTGLRLSRRRVDPARSVTGSTIHGHRRCDIFRDAAQSMSIRRPDGDRWIRGANSLQALHEQET